MMVVGAKVASQMEEMKDGYRVVVNEGKHGC
jgi:hypothetical protein